MHDAVSYELGVFKSRDHGKDAFLFSEKQVRLKADDIVKRTRGVVLSELNDRFRTFFGSRVDKPNRFQRTEKQRVSASSRHNFDGHTALEHFAVLKTVQNRLFCVYKFVVKRIVFLFRHRAVYIVGRSLSVTGSKKRFRHIYAVCGNYRRGGIKEMQLFRTEEFGYLCAQCVACQWTRRNNGIVFKVKRRNLFFNDLDIFVFFYGTGDVRRKFFSVNGKCSACGNCVFVCTANNKAVKFFQFLFQQSDCIFQSLRTQRVRTAEFAKIVARMSGGVLGRFHLEKADFYAPFRKLVSRFAARKTRADYISPLHSLFSRFLRCNHTRDFRRQRFCLSF